MQKFAVHKCASATAAVAAAEEAREGDERAVFQVIVKLFENGPGAVSSGAPAATQGCSRSR